MREGQRATRWRLPARALVALTVLALLALAGCGGRTARQAPTPQPTQTASATSTPNPQAWPTVTLPPRWSRTRPLTLYDVTNDYLAQMSLDEKIGQLFIVTLTGTGYDANDAAMVGRQGAGGVLLFSANITSADQTQRLLATAQAGARVPLLTVTDEEGGSVDRLTQIYGPRPSATAMGANGSPAFAQQQGRQAAQDMRALGLNTDFAPDVDVQLANGPNQLNRTFGSTPGAVTSLAGSYLNGLQGANVIGCLKHFPGLGDATSDAHLGLPVITRSRDQLEAVELAPYRSLIASGQVGMVMVTDLLMPALDPNLPAELSPSIVTGVLRNELGYDGVVVTDSLIMEGITQTYSLPEAGVRALLAGDDLLEGPSSAGVVAAMKQAIRDAISDGRLSEQRIDESVRRILALKIRAGLLPIPAAGMAPVAPLGGMTPATTSAPIALKPES